MKSCLHLLAACVLALFAAVPAAYAQSPDLSSEERDMVRVMRHPDGTRSVYKRQSNQRGMRCATYTASGQLAAINDYVEGRYGQLVACTIYSNKRQPIYKVSYGYDSQSRLVEERMYSVASGKLVQRVIYRYDANGNRSKPLIVSLGSEVAGAAPTPTSADDINAINQGLRSGRRSPRR